jgi:hypothetical protein
MHTESKIASAHDALAYILAGHARVTLVSTRTGVRFTYRVRAHDLTDPMGNTVRWFVDVLSGPDNESDYRFFGTVFAKPSLSFKHSAKARGIGADAPSVKAFAWVLGNLAAGRMPAECEIWHEGSCGRCGRALTDPESIASGLGPVCREKAAA